jgi:hypothetical protein
VNRLSTVAVLLGGVVLGLAGWGCSATSLSRDEQNQMLMAKDRRLQEELHAAQEKIAALTASGAQPRAGAAMPADPFRAVAVRIDRLSGVVNESRPPAEQRLRVILEPLDATGDVVKRAGSLELETFERPPAASPAPRAAAATAAAGSERLYHLWKFAADDLRQTWLSGLGSYGYVLKLPWPDARPPAGETLHLRARFKTLAGEVLEAEMEIPLPSPAAAAGAAPPAR